jgi:hypothetical protein
VTRAAVAAAGFLLGVGAAWASGCNRCGQREAVPWTYTIVDAPHAYMIGGTVTVGDALWARDSRWDAFVIRVVEGDGSLLELQYGR